MKRKLLLVTGIIFSFILTMSFLPSHPDEVKHFHTPQELKAIKDRLLSPLDSGQYFLHSSHCEGCHGYDSAGVANIDESGMSVNLFDHWQSSMMANAARDPLWRAKVSHEILVNPAHAAELQDKCTDCHAPMGRYTAQFHGVPHYGLNDLATDTLGQDGVACEACHTIGTNVGTTFSGIIPYDTSRQVYGPFTDPTVGPMQLYEGYTPTYSDHMNRARLCSSCHTLITNSVDLSGNFTGGIFPEQATYHEYLNSHFPADTITCQTCHMPQITYPIIIANGFASLTPRTPFNQHVFVGANTFMLNMIKNNKASLGADAEDWKFDSTIADTKALLMQSSVVFSLQLDSSVNDSGYFSVRIENKAGHKFPSGYPSRRAVLQFVVTDNAGDTVFKSGTFTNDQHVAGETPAFEPHHDVINQSDVPQIYEMVMGDVNHNFTSVLERASYLLKDNRIPPGGFTTTHYDYDTVKISNDAIADPDFNKTNSIEGSGVDYVHYHVPLSAAVGNVSIHARLFYQSVPPKWVQELLTYSSAEIDSFRVMFSNADQTPFLMASDSIMNFNIGISQNPSVESGVMVYPTITSDGNAFVKSLSAGRPLKLIEIYSSDGKKVSQFNILGNMMTYTLSLPSTAGMYLIKIKAGDKAYYHKIIRQ